MSSSDMTLTIRNTQDAIVARMEARNLARTLGFDLKNQMNVSLATWALVCSLESETSSYGQITFDRLQKKDQLGIKVVFKITDPTKVNALPNAFGDAKWLVDELTVETLPSEGVKVTAVKWNT